jgi:hypothetical protein
MVKRKLYIRFLLVSLVCFAIVQTRGDRVVTASCSRTHFVSSTPHNHVPLGRSILLDTIVNPLDSSAAIAIESLRGGAYLIPAGWNPMGYKITALGEQFLSLGDSLECDVGRFIASLKSSRKRRSTIKDSWLEIVRASKKGQAMRIYRSIDELIDFCIKTGLID